MRASLVTRSLRSLRSDGVIDDEDGCVGSPLIIVWCTSSSSFFGKVQLLLPRRYA